MEKTINKNEDAVLYDLYQNETAIKTNIVEKTIRTIEKQQIYRYEMIKKIIKMVVIIFIISLILITAFFMKSIIKTQRDNSKRYMNEFNTSSHTFISEDVFELLNN